MENKRRNLSGIYLLDQFPGEEKRCPTCVEDCQEETRNKWLESLDREALMRTINYLCETLREISDQFEILGGWKH